MAVLCFSKGQRGRDACCCSRQTGDVDWNELAVTTGYLPLIQTGVTYLARREAQERLATDTRLPQPIIVKVSEQQREALVTIIDPQGKRLASFHRTRAGRYRPSFLSRRFQAFTPTCGTRSWAGGGQHSARRIRHGCH